MTLNILNSLCLLIWLVLHLVYITSRELLDWINLIWNQRHVWSCWPGYSKSKLGNVELFRKASTLPKHPKHIAFLIPPEETDTSRLGMFQKLKLLLRRSRIVEHFRTTEQKSLGQYHRSMDLEALSRLITWAWAADIPVISLYDYHGEIKEMYQDLMHYIHCEMTLNIRNVQKYREDAEIPKLYFHNVPGDNGNINNNGHIISDYKSTGTVHIQLYSYDDGRPRIADIAKSLCENSSDSINNLVTERELDLYIHQMSTSSLPKEHLSSEPDTLMICGHTKSTLGFLPWNIRLSEMFWVPKLSRVEVSDFLNTLHNYAGCQQRFGT